MSSASSGRLELRITYIPTGSRPRDLLVKATTATTIADLSRALSDRVGTSPGEGLYNDRTGPLSPARRLGDGMLREGDVIRDAAPPDAHHAAAGAGSGLELCVVGGPRAGARVPLPAGGATVGRAANAGICIDDPSLSRLHARIDIGAAGPTVTDAGSSNGTAVEGRRLAPGEARPLSPDDTIEVGRTLLQVRPAARTDETVARRRGTRVAFNRMPRMARPQEAAELELPAPPSKPGGPRLPLAASLGPLVLGVVMYVVTKQPTLLLFSALTPIMAVSTFVSDRRGGRKTHAAQLAEFRARASSLDEQLTELNARELAERRALAPDPATVALRAVRQLPDLWERRPSDPDFLLMRLGTADLPATAKVKFPEGGEKEERAPVERRLEETATLASVPLVARLDEVGGIGLSGDPAQAEALARWLVVEAATLQSPRELLVFAALSEERARDWRWLAWLPHAASTRTVVDHRNLAVGELQVNGLLRAMRDVAELRRQERRDRFAGNQRAAASMLLLIDEDVAPSRAIVDELLEGSAETGIGIVWLGRRRRDLPGGCTVVVELDAAKAAMDVSFTRHGRDVRDATPDGIDVAIADEVARGLAPVRDVTESRSGASIPRSALLLETLELPDLDGWAVARRWEDAAPGGLESPLGVGPDGILTIDLRRDGPHGLVAGTTGAGKSELLQVFVAGLALSRPPNRASFLFVDYKGGTAFKDCVELPHTVGMVTDLDEHLTRRALLSLNAELRRREHILNAAGAKDLIELERLRPDEAPPSLIIVIDEFAALKAEVPEFVDGVVDIAQRGRSLGVHLILATQRPGGVVSENIRANTNLRIALRVQQPAESDDVIGDGSAARISKALPGRAFARTGHSELTEFQSFYGGGVTPHGAGDGELALTELVLGEPLDDDDDPETTPGGQTDLERIVVAVEEATAARGIVRPQSPWLPPLPAVLSVDALDEVDDAPHVIPLGLVDEPGRQLQSTYELDLERDGSLFIYGTSGAGKTTLLRTIAVQLARRSSPRELQLFGLDYAGHGLDVLEALPHVGAVIGGDDEERLTRLLTMLRREIDERGRRFAQRGVSTLSEFRAGAEPQEWPPRLVVLLDSYAGFTSASEGVNLGALTQQLPRIIAEGRAAGVHVIATADRRSAVPMAVASLVPRRIVLRLADEDEYSTLGLDRKGVQGAVLPPGRGFIEDTLELQTAIVGTATTGDGPAAAITAEGARLDELHGDQRAPGIPRMPESLSRAELPRATDPARPLLGVDEVELAPAAIDISESAFMVCGPFRSGRTTALETIARSIRDADPSADLHLLAPRRSALTSLDGVFTSVASGTDGCQEAAQRLLELVMSRNPEEPHRLLAIVVDDIGELADGPAGNSLETILRRGRDVEVRVIASCESGQARGFQQVLRELRKDGNGLLLQPNLDMDGDLLGVRLPRRSALQPSPGRGFLVDNGVPVLVQVAADAR